MNSLFSELRTTFTEAHRRALHTHEAVLTCVSIPIEALDLFKLFDAADDGKTPCILWRSSNPSVEILGWDCSLELTADGDGRFARIDETWQALLKPAVIRGPQRPRLLGGFRFDVHSIRAQHWSAFPDASMVLATILFVKEAGAGWVVFQKIVGTQDEPEAIADDCLRQFGLLRRNLPQEQPARAPRRLNTYCLSAEQWQAKVAHAVQVTRSSDAEKIVLAREVLQTYDEPVCPSAVMRQLQQTNPHAHIFAIRKGSRCFLGASPERLVRIADGQIHTQALAGTIGRSEDEALDQELGRRLMTSTKNRQEHAFVVSAIRSALAPLTYGLTSLATPNLCKLPHLQHLSTPILATPKPGCSILRLVQSLHPTPAVAGYKLDVAMAHIRKYEGFDRGWYAAPLGWMDSDGNGDFIVALRSALIEGTGCRLFAGCGIVRDSDPQSEYEETLLKLVNMQLAIERTCAEEAASA